MLSESQIMNRLEHIYAKIPNGFPCRHCHECCDPIIWFKPEEILIRDYMEKHNIEYVVWSIEEFKKNNMRCPYLKNDRCSIYPVRPIVCRLQGNICELPCKYNKIRLMSKKQFNKVKKEFDILVRDVNGTRGFYGTRKLSI